MRAQSATAAVAASHTLYIKNVVGSCLLVPRT